MTFKPLTLACLEWCREDDKQDVKGEFDFKQLVLGYDCYIDGVLSGCIFICNRGTCFTLDGYNKLGGMKGFFRSMRYIIKEYDKTYSQPLMIVRFLHRDNLEDVFKRFGFKFTQQVSVWLYYRRQL